VGWEEILDWLICKLGVDSREVKGKICRRQQRKDWRAVSIVLVTLLKGEKKIMTFKRGFEAIEGFS